MSNDVKPYITMSKTIHARLVALRSDGPPPVELTERENVLGRATTQPTAGVTHPIATDDRSMSRTHAAVEVITQGPHRPKRFLLKNIHDRNVLWLWEPQLTKLRIDPGDVVYLTHGQRVTLGRMEFEFKVPARSLKTKRV